MPVRLLECCGAAVPQPLSFGSGPRWCCTTVETVSESPQVHFLMAKLFYFCYHNVSFASKGKSVLSEGVLHKGVFDGGEFRIL